MHAENKDAPKRRALIVAWTADRYGDQPALHGDAAENARQIAELLRDPSCCAFDEVEILHDPRRSDLHTRSLALIRNASAGDSTLLYYSGFCEVVGSSLVDPFQDLRLIVQEENGSTRFAIRDLAEVAQHRLGRDLLLITDATLSGGPVEERTDKPLAYRDTRVIALIASAAAPQRKGLGPLTQELASRLRSQRTHPAGDGYVSVVDVTAFLKSALPPTELRCWAGRGAADWILLPAQAMPQAGHRLPGELPSALEEGAKLLVLVVDDHEDNRASYSTLLRHYGYEAVEASNGSEALDVALARLPDAVLMDLAMPVLDGREAGRLLRASEETAHIPIILLTAMALSVDRARFLDEGFDGLLIKPSMPSMLLNELKRVIDARRNDVET